VQPASIITAQTSSHRATRSGVDLLRIVTAVAAALAATGSAAQTPLPDTPQAFSIVLREWAESHGVERAIIVVRREGRIVYRSSVGGADPAQPVHLASLSKAITAACIATLIRDGKLSFDTPAATALAKFMARVGRGGDPRLRRVTVAQLLTHRAGFGTLKDDPASGPALMEYLTANPATARPSPKFLAWALNHKLMHEPGAKFVYSNTGYLALGAIIEEATGKLYAPYCREAALGLARVDGQLEPSWRVLWSYAGWRMTADDYLTFLDLFDADDRRLGTAAKKWMLDGTGKTVSAQGEGWYGLGTYVGKAGAGVSLRHFGSWAYRTTGRNAASRTSMLTLAVRQGDGTAWFVHASPRPPRTDEERPGVELQRALFDAYRGVKRWN
jgi:CubicO group peptidase (beta-lactamase class C family)